MEGVIQGKDGGEAGRNHFRQRQHRSSGGNGADGIEKSTFRFGGLTIKSQESKGSEK